jgi:hypothetical protein
MNFEQIIGAILFLTGVFLLADVVLSYSSSFNSSTIVSVSNPFLVEVLIGIFLTVFGLYLLKIIPQQKRNNPFHRPSLN